MWRTPNRKSDRCRHSQGVIPVTAKGQNFKVTSLRRTREHIALKYKGYPCLHAVNIFETEIKTAYKIYSI